MKRLALVVVALGFGLAACELTPCDEYVNYVCACHTDDPDYDCSQLSTTYANAPADVQDTCVVALDDLQAEDEAAGLTCDAAF